MTVSKAYSSISPESVAAKVGVSVQAVQRHAEEHGWGTDIATGALKPVASAPAPAPVGGSNMLQQLTNWAAQIERTLPEPPGSKAG